jgi:hypothetical protein
MTTLAQQIVNQYLPYPDEVDEMLRVTNADKKEKKHITQSLGYMALAKVALDPDMPVVTEEIVHAKATKFAFTDDAPYTVIELIKNGSIPKMVVVNTAHLPAAITWIEWKENHPQVKGGYQIGGLWIKGTEWSKIVPAQPLSWEEKFGSILTLYDNAMGFCAPIACCWLPPLPITYENPEAIRRWSCTDDDDEDNKWISTTLGAVLNALFLINTPRVCTVQQVQHCAKKQKARQKAGKKPLVEYRQLTLRVGVGATAYKSNNRNISDVSSGLKRKYHNVIGHFRTITNKGAQRAVYVDEHWRGDVAKGVIFRDRTVKL